MTTTTTTTTTTLDAYVPANLTRWTLPDCYAGASWHAYYSSGVGQSRDSDALERSNFTCMLDALGGESDTVRVVCENHWAVGWVEWIAIHHTDARALAIADDIAAGLADYPVIDEEHYSYLEYTEACNYWERLSIRDRVQLCIDAHLSIFAARRDYLPPDDTGALYELLTRS